jgi:hypothetical protein
MNHEEHPNHSTLTRELRDALAEVAAPGRPPLAAITSRGRAHRQRRLAGLAGLGVAGVAAGAALVLSLAGVLGAAPARSTGTIRTAAFTLTSNANGTDTLTLNLRQLLDPAAFQRALAQHGIPALVKTGTFCSSTPQPPGNGAIVAYLGNRPVGPGDHHFSGPATKVVVVIDPSALPAGTELSFGYFDQDRTLMDTIIYTGSYTCSSGQPPATP